MAYSSPTDLYGFYPKSLTAGLDGAEVVLRIATADAFIDGYVAQRYMTPLAGTPETTPPLIRRISTILAGANFILARAQNTPAWITDEIAWAREALGLIADGTLMLVDPTGVRVPQRTDIGIAHSTTETYTPTFGVAPSILESVDPDRAQDEDDSRS